MKCGQIVNILFGTGSSNPRIDTDIDIDALVAKLVGYFRCVSFGFAKESFGVGYWGRFLFRYRLGWIEGWVQIAFEKNQ